MREEVIDVFRSVNINGVPEIKEAVSEVKQALLTRNQCIAAEIAWRKKEEASGKGCIRCGRKDMLTVDHNVPKVILADMGIDFEREFIPENLVLMCRPCNNLKSGHLDFSLPQTKATLLKLLEKL